MRGDGLAPRVERELHHLPWRPALWRIVRRKYDGIYEDAAAPCLLKYHIEIHPLPGVFTIGEDDDHLPVGTVPGSFRVLLPTNGDQHRFVLTL